MTPTGNSEAPVTTRAAESHKTKNIAPTITEVGNKIRWSGPIIRRVI